MKTLFCLFIVFFTFSSAFLENDSFLALGDSGVLPGCWHIGEGLDLLNLRQMAPVLQMTYATGQYTPDGAYKLPDGVAFIDTDTCNLFAQTSSSETYQDYKTTDTTTISAEAKFKVVSASFSETEKQVREQIFNNKKSVSRTVVKCQMYDIMHFNNLGLSPFFKSALESLPSTYDSFAYKSLINDFGTHFRKRITLGGKLNQLAFTDSEYTKKYSLDSISRQAGASFYVSVSASSTHESEITQEFKQSTSLTQIEAIGGSPWVSGADSWAAWASSIPGKPEVIYQELYPISNLISDPAKKVNLEKAINDYLFVSGCTHPKASNFNPEATMDDGSCNDPHYIKPELRCAGTGLIFNVPDGCIDDGGVHSQNDNLQVYCCNGQARFCLSGEGCQWRGGCPALASDNWSSCSRDGLPNDWMATCKCNNYNGIGQVFCNTNGEVYFK